MDDEVKPVAWPTADAYATDLADGAMDNMGMVDNMAVVDNVGVKE